MRRIFMVLMLAALVVVMFAPAVSAINERCDTIPCNGTSNKDKLSERQGRVADRINGRGGNDTLLAGRYSGERDLLNGGPGNDDLDSDDGDSRDELNGGPGHDRCDVNDGDRYRSCEVVEQTL